MPAILPARLRQQAALLVEHFDQPAAFVRSLHHLLEFYADRTYRPGKGVTPPPLLQAYNVRPPVLRQVLLELTPWGEEYPLQGLALCDALWEQPYLEFRQLAAYLLGSLPASVAGEAILRVRQWSKGGLEPRLVEALLIQGLARLRREAPDQVLELVESWLAEEALLDRQLGLRALLPLVQEVSFNNLPVFFRLLQPLARNVPATLRPDLLDILIAMARRSPYETAYFLRQNLDLPDAGDMPWLIRQVAPEFPPDVERSLRDAARDASLRSKS